ncbi:MAG: hypothetical protein R3C39_02780 [Dehalococcoidia bacterium]
MKRLLRSSVPFEIPADFLQGRARLDVPVLVFGVSRGWLAESDAIALVAAGSTGPDQAAALEAIRAAAGERSLAVSDESHVHESGSVLGDSPAGVWLYLASAYWTAELARIPDWPDGLDGFELLFCEFGHPDEFSDLIRWMPAKPGEPRGPAAIEDRRRRYLIEAARRFAPAGVGGSASGSARWSRITALLDWLHARTIGRD